MAPGGIQSQVFVDGRRVWHSFSMGGSVCACTCVWDRGTVAKGGQRTWSDDNVQHASILVVVGPLDERHGK